MNDKSFFRCNKCLLPNTKPDLFFDENGVCFACKYTDYYEQIDWDQRRGEIDVIVDERCKVNNSDYDCLIAVSGGKDSTYQVHLVTQVLGLKPLLVSFEPSFPTKVGRQNLQNMVDAYNCDLLQMRKSPTYQKLSRIAFNVVGDHEWPNHVGIYCWPMQVAIKYDIPLIFYGEGGGLIGLGDWDVIANQKETTREFLDEYAGMNGYRLSDMLDLDRTINKKDVIPYVYPDREQLIKLGLKAYNLGYFFHWDVKKNIDVISEKGWVPNGSPVEGTFTNFEDIDCGFMPYHQYGKFIKYGYGRATDHASYEIRHGRMTKKEAVGYIQECEWRHPQKYYQEYLEFLGIDEATYFSVLDRYVNPILFERDSRNKITRIDGGSIKPEKIWYDSFK